MKAHEILEKAARLVKHDRAYSHGSMLENHQNIAQLWNGYLHNIDFVTPEDVANMMELLKIARRKSGLFNVDDYVDGAGYAAIAYGCTGEANENKS